MRKVLSLITVGAIVFALLSGFAPSPVSPKTVQLTAKNQDGTPLAGMTLKLYKYPDPRNPAAQEIVATALTDSYGVASFASAVQVVRNENEFTNYAIRGIGKNGELIVHHFFVNANTDFNALNAELNSVTAQSVTTEGTGAITDTILASCGTETLPIFDGSETVSPTWTTISELHSTGKQQVQFTYNSGSQVAVDAAIQYTYPSLGSWTISGSSATSTGGSRSTGWKTYGTSSSASGQAVQTQFYYTKEYWHTDSGDVPGTKCRSWTELYIGNWYGGLQLASIPAGQSSYDNQVWSNVTAGSFGPIELLAGGTTGTVSNGTAHGWKTGFNLMSVAVPVPGLTLNGQIQYTTTSTLEWRNYSTTSTTDYYANYANYPGPSGSRTSGNDATMYYWSHQ